MLLTYHEFATLVPKETLEFVNKTLPELKYHIDKGSISFQSNNNNCVNWNYILHQEDIKLAIFLHIFYEINPKYASILTSYGYNDKTLIFTKHPENNELFQEYSSCFCFYDSLSDYQVLTPTAIISHFLSENYDEYNSEYKFLNNTHELCSHNIKEIHNTLNSFNEQAIQELIIKIKMEFNANLPIEVIDYLETTSKIHQIIENRKRLPSYITNENDIEVLSLFIALLYSTKNLKTFKRYLNTIGINEKSIQNTLAINNLVKTIEKTQEDYLLLNMHYTKYKEKSIPEILNKLTDRKLTQSNALESFLNYQNQNISLLHNLTDLEKLENIETMQSLSSFKSEIKNYLENTIRIHSRLHKHITNTSSYNFNLILTNEDITLLSLIIALFYETEENYFLLEKNGITLQTIASTCELDISLFKNIIKEELNYQILKKEYLPLIKNDPNLEIKDILKLFLDQSPVLEKLMKASGKSYSILENEITTGVEQMPSLEERFNSLANLEVTSIDIQSINSIINFGNGLLTHSEFISSETDKLQESREIDESSNLIMEITSKINPSSSKKGNLLSIKSFLLRLRKKQTLFSLMENNENLERTINKSINNLQDEIIRYDQILKYLGLYQQKNYEHLIEVTKALELKEGDNLSTNPQNIAISIGNNAYLSLLEDKKNIFETANIFIMGEIIRIGQTMMNHSLSLKALIISKQDLIPLAKAELVLAESGKKDQQALNIYTTILDFCQNLYNQNIEGMKNSIELFRNTLPQNTFTKIESDVNTYLLQIQNANITPTTTHIR